MQQSIGKWLFTGAILLVLTSAVLAQRGRPEVTNYPPYDYFSDNYVASPQNWAVIQDQNGLIVVANESGLLTFDGRSWNTVRGSERLRLFKLAKGPGGYIYSGGVGDLGYVKSDSTGNPVWHSLFHLLPDSLKDLPRISRIVSHEGKVYFLAKNTMLAWNGEQFRHWQAETIFRRAFSSPNGLAIFQNKQGLFWLEDNKLIPFQGQEKIKGLDIRMAIDQGPSGFLLVTWKQGVMRLKQGELTQVNPLEGINSVYNSCVLPNGNVAIGTDGYGIVIIDSTGQVIDRISERDGLQQEQVVFPYFDREGGIWAALFSGVSRVSYPASVTRVDKTHGLKSIVLTVLKHHDQLYIGTLDGCYRAQVPASTQAIELIKVKGINASSWQLLELEDQVISIGDDGVFAIDSNQQLTTLEKGQLFTAGCKKKGKPNGIYITRNDKVLSYMFQEGKWKKERPLAKLPFKIIYLVEDEKNRLWASGNGLSMIQEVNGQHQATTFDSTSGMLEGMEIIEVTIADGKVLIGTDIGFFEYDEVNRKIVPCSKYGDRFTREGKMAYTLEETEKGDLWLSTVGGVRVLRKDQNWALDSHVLAGIPYTEAWAIYEDPDHVVWISTTEGLIRYDPKVPKNYKLPYQILISSVTTGDGDLLRGGAYKIGASVGESETQSTGVVELPYTKNALVFNYSALFYEAREKLTYSYLLEGQDEQWSDWTKETRKEYTNLREGNYVFKVRAKNVYGTISETESYPFSILPPWYRTGLAYAAYGVLGILFLWLILYLNTIRLRQAKKRLEVEVAARTAEISAQSKTLEAVNKELRELDQFKEGMTNMIVHDLKTPLNVILNPDESKTTDQQLESVQQVGGQMLNLVMDILDVSRNEQAKMKLQSTKVNSVELLDSAIKQVQHLARQKQVRIITRKEQNPVVWGEKELLERVLVNLLTNAIKFSRPGSPVEVTLEGSNHQKALFSVRDEGPGIPEQNHKKVFEKFGQVIARKSGGLRATGLGLTFCKMTVEAHGGTIGLESVEGEGATFWFTVPIFAGQLAPSPVEQPVPTEVEPVIAGWDATDKEFLQPFVDQLQSLPVYKVTAIEAILLEVKANPSPGVANWVENLERSIYLGDQAGFETLLAAVSQNKEKA